MSTIAEIMGLGGSTAPIWTSTRTVRQWEVVTSPLDGELYRRTAATGASATDPANDVANYVAVSYRRQTALSLPAPPTAVGTGWTVTTTASSMLRMSQPTLNVGVRTLVVDITGRGALKFLAVRCSGSSTAALYEVLVDGRTLYSANLTLNTTGQRAQLLGGLAPSGTAGDFIPVLAELQFRRGLQIYATGTAASTSGKEFWYAYEGDA